jgi:putative DNA methylase
MEPNKARLMAARDFKKAFFDSSEFGASPLRALLYAVHEIENEVDVEDVLSHLHDAVSGYFNVHERLIALAEYIAVKKASIDEPESRAAHILTRLIRNERL